MKTTIFTRILLATLLPLTFVFVLVIYTISNIIYLNGATAAKEATSWEAEQMTRQFSAKLDEMRALLLVVSNSLGDLDFSAPGAPAKAETLIRRLIDSDETFLSTWFAFEKDVIPGNKRFYKTFFRGAAGVEEIHDLDDQVLEDLGSASWYAGAVTSRDLTLEMAEPYDYGPGIGKLVTVALTAPVVDGEKVIGAVGIDMHHKDMFVGEETFSGGRWLIMLLSAKGDIIYSSDPEKSPENFFTLPFAKMPAMREAIAEEKAFLEEDFAPVAGEDSLICIHPITWEEKGERIFLYLSAATREINALARSSVEIIISTSVLGFLLLGFSVFVATRNIVRPIKQLTVDFNKISHGDLELAPAEEREIKRGANVVELDILQQALWNMLGQISQTHDLRLKAAEERMEKDRVLAASQAKSQFLANMSHEIRTPMNAILGISEILLHNDRLQGQERKYVNDIKISSGALLAIINDILDISRLESGKLTLTEQDYDFGELLENLRAMGEYLAAPGGLDFTFTVRPGLPRYLKGDEVRLRQVLLNLISNACKFTPKGRVSFEASAENGFLRFVVEDTGHGISRENQATLFEPFRRVESAHNQAIQGTGLGLSISKNLVDMMGGEISLESEPGHGSTFTVRIPFIVGDENALAEKNAEISIRFTPGVRVLVVDDNEINLSVAEGLLTDLYGLECVLANSGAKALEILREQEFTLIFMDQMMPEMDGVECARRIREMGGAFSGLPIIALTANAVKGTREYLLGVGIDDYLTKPIEIAEMNAILRKWIPRELRARD